MLNFDVERFLSIQSGAVALAGPIDEAIGKELRSGAENIFFLGAGGAAILMQPAAMLLQRRSTFPTFIDISAELILAGSRHLGPNSIVIIPSRSGTTRESVAMLEACLAKGARVITLICHADTPLGRAPTALVNFAEDDTSSESFYLQSLLVAVSVMHHRGECPAYDQIVRELTGLPQALVAVKQGFEERAETLAETFKAEPYHIITGAGPVWPEAFYYGMCILEEMQWIRTRPVHASDFFHGTLELVEKDVSVLILKGEDETRPLADRVEAFVTQYHGALTIFDTRDLPTPGVSADVRALIGPVLLATIFERLSAHLEVKRNHPLTTRRYYNTVAY